MKTTIRLLAGAGVSLALAGGALAAVASGDVPKTQVTSATAFARLAGATGVSLQWNWNTRPGSLRASARDGYLALHGEQHAKDGGSLALDGVVTRIEERAFTFSGRIVIHDAEANVDCVREGHYTFRITGSRKYWRMKEQEAHCPGRADLTDYVDIYFR